MNYTDSNLYDISSKIKLLRVSKGLTQKELASLLGVKTSAVSKYETSAIFPSLPVLKKICEIFNISSDELLGISNKNYYDLDELLSSLVDLSNLPDEDVQFVKNTVKFLESKQQSKDTHHN